MSGARDAVQDLCSHSNVAVVVRDAAGADEALLSTEHAPGLAEAYVDLRPGSPTRVVVVDGETRQDLERRTLPDGASLEISIETVARVVCSAVESSLAARAAAAPPPPPVLAPPPAQPEDRGAAWDVRASLFGATENFGAGFHGGGGAALGFSHGRAAVRVGIFASVAGYASAGVNVQGTDGKASFGLISARMMPMVEWRAAHDITAFLGLGGGADWTHVTPDRPLDGATFSGSTSVDAIGAGILGARLRLTSSLSALFAVDADVDLNRHNYVISARDGSSAPFFSPARIRPMALAGLSLSFGGSGVAASPAAIEERR
ncbi:MAG: hypothetical protein ABI548_18430 [Polyangiaceae bacterium]